MFRNGAAVIAESAPRATLLKLLRLLVRRRPRRALSGRAEWLWERGRGEVEEYESVGFADDGRRCSQAEKQAGSLGT